MFCLVFVLIFRYSESLFWLVSSYFCFRFYYLLLPSFAYFLLFLCFAYYCVLCCVVVAVVVFHSILFILNSRHFVHFAILLLFGSHILSASAFEHRYIQLIKKIIHSMNARMCVNVCLCVAYEFKLLAVECRVFFFFFLIFPFFYFLLLHFCRLLCVCIFSCSLCFPLCLHCQKIKSSRKINK